jgi:hypothetical protein
MTIRRGFSARDNPSAMEAYVAKTARRLSIPASQREAKDTFAPTAEVLSEASAHFADHCATCHANDGSGKTDIGQNLYPKAPHLRQSETQNLTDSQIYYIIHNGMLCASHWARGKRTAILKDGGSQWITRCEMTTGKRPTHTSVTRCQTPRGVTTVTPGTPWRCFATSFG